jgi:hypothetical protein
MWSKMYIGLDTKFPSCLRDLMKIEFFRHIFEKYSKVKFHENPYSGSRDFHTEEWTDRTNLIVSFRNLANAPKHTTFKHKNTQNTPFWCVQNLRSFQRRIMQKFSIYLIIIITIYMKQFWFIYRGRFGYYLVVLNTTKPNILLFFCFLK